MNVDLSCLNLDPSVSYSTDPILEYMFDTAAEAINQARVWGFDGYRTYLINGQLKYIPCQTASQYQEATRLYMVQGAIVAQGQEVFGDRLVGYQYTERDTIKGDPIFTLGNFTITAKLTTKQDVIYTLADTKRGYTAQDFTLDGIEALKTQTITDVTAKLKFDKTNIEKYVTYASLRERFRVAMQEIAETFPASMHIVPYSITYPVVYNYYAYPNGDASVFKIRSVSIYNPYNIDFYKSGETAPQPEYVAPLRNFSLNYSKYELYYKNTAYKIISITPPTSVQDPNNLTITVLGNPFEDDVTPNGTVNVSFYIKPIQAEIDAFYENATDLVTYLLNKESTPLYSATFNVPHREDDGTFLIMPQTLVFPMYDDFNVDIFSDPFDAYLTDLNAVADDFDDYKTDLIARFLTSASLQEYDTDDRKTYATLQAYASMFDNVKRYADGIAYMTKVSYDAIDNVPDVLLKNFAHTLGWKTYEIEKDDTLVESLFDISGDRQGDDTPAEIDIELWRRIIINSFYLFKSKGTRKSIEFALELVGIPIEIMDINEYVYVADHPLDYGTYYNLFHEALEQYPMDTEGYPTTPSNLHFQAYGGSMLNNAQNIGPYDNGQAYMNSYRKFSTVKAFDLERTIDNKKSWVKTDVPTNNLYDLLLRDTNYNIKDSRLVINSKEADAAISSQMTFDYYVYSFYKKYNYSISVSGATVTPSALTFNEYLREIMQKLINPRNRKVIQTYPVLSKIYWDYLQYSENLGLQTIDYTKTLDFISRFDTYWVKLVQQFIPATTIFLAGKKFGNATVTKCKFQYKHGLNTSKSWLGTDGSEFQDDALKPSPNGNIDLFRYKGYLGADLHGECVLHYECELSPKACGFLIRGGVYEADNYGFYRHYAAQQNVLLEEHANFGTMTGLTPSNTTLLYFATGITTGATLTIGNGVFVSGSTYDDNLGEGHYVGMVRTGTTGSIHMVLGNESPFISVNDVPIQKYVMMALRNVPVEPNEYYVVEGDIMFTSNVSGNTVYSYVGLVPLLVETPPHFEPEYFITDNDMMEGCFGDEKYDKYNWIHMKTKFRVNDNYVNILLLGQDIHYTGTTANVYLKDFTVKKFPVDINFITPPPLPHICYYETGYTFMEPLNTVPEFPEFNTGNWGVGVGPSGFYFVLPSTGDSATITFYKTGGTASNGKGDASMSYISSYTETPTGGTMYYYRMDVEVLTTGSTLTYVQTPTIYVNFFDDSGVTIPSYLNYPVKFKCDHNHPSITFEGFYYPLTVPTGSTYITIVADNRTVLSADYSVRLSNFQLKKVNIFYKDETGNKYWYQQPFAFGYSMNTGTTEPENALGGTAGRWVVPYVQSGTGHTTGDTAGMYQEYDSMFFDTFPLMHISRTYVNKYNFTPADTFIDINLTRTCGLGYKFYYEDGNYPAIATTPDGVTIGNQLFMSGAMTYTLDGFYPTTEMLTAGLGPFYTPKSVYGMYTTLGVTDIICYKGANNYIPMMNNYADNWYDLSIDTGYTADHTVPPDFKSSLTTVTLATRNDVRYLKMLRYNLIKVEASLIYDSSIALEQVVLIKLMGTNGVLYNQMTYQVGGSANPLYSTLESRTLSYTFDGYFRTDEELYLVVQPKSYNCYIRQQEEIDCVGGYILSGTTGSTFTHFVADKMVTSSGDTYTYFTGSTYQYMSGGTYDTLTFRPTGIYGSVNTGATISEHTEVYDKDFQYYMCFVTGATATGKTIVLQSKAVDYSNYLTTNSYINAIRQLPPPFTGVTWQTFEVDGTETIPPTGNTWVHSGHTYWYYTALTGTTYTVNRKSYVKVYESDVTGTTSNTEKYLIAFYKSGNRTFYKYGYNVNFFDDPINRFYDATDDTTREIFKYGTVQLHAESDGVYLKYILPKDLAGYPVTGEFIGRLTGVDTCGHFVTIYLLLFIDLVNNAAAPVFATSPTGSGNVTWAVDDEQFSVDVAT